MQCKRLLTTFSFIVILFIIGCSSAKTPDSEQTYLNKGDIAPMFEMEDIAGSLVSLESFAGEKVYIKYWASWCSICLAGLEEIDQLSSEDTPFQVISIVSPNYHGEMAPDDFNNWFQSLDTKHLTVLLDNNGTWANQFSVAAYPTSYYIGSDGILAKTIVGHNPNDVITKEMEKIK